MSHSAFGTRAFRTSLNTLFLELFMVRRNGASLPLIYLCAIGGNSREDKEKTRRGAKPAASSQNKAAVNQFFFTNSDFSFIGPKPSILQSML